MASRAIPVPGNTYPLTTGRRPTWAILAVGVLLAALAMGMVEVIVFTTHGRIDTQIALARLEERLYQQVALEQAALNAPLANEVRAERVRTERLETVAALAELRRAGADEALLARLQVELGDYEAAVDDTLALFAAGQEGAARRAEAERVAPRLATLRATIEAASERANVAARRQDRLMGVGVAGTIALAVLATSGLSWRWERARARLERRLAHQAYHDALTGLPNRALFVTLLDRALARAAGQREALAVLFLDLDGFKAVKMASATRPGTGCWSSWRSACAPACARRTPWRGWGGTSSPSCCPPPWMRAGRSGSRNGSARRSRLPSPWPGRQ